MLYEIIIGDFEAAEITILETLKGNAITVAHNASPYLVHSH